MRQVSGNRAVSYSLKQFHDETCFSDVHTMKLLSATLSCRQKFSSCVSGLSSKETGRCVRIFYSEKFMGKNMQYNMITCKVSSPKHI